MTLDGSYPLPTVILSLLVNLAPEVLDVSWGDVH